MSHILRLANNTVPAGNQVSNTVTKTLLADTYLIAANSNVGSDYGQVYKFKAFGYISSFVNATPGNIQVNIELGGNILGTATINFPIGGMTNAGFMLHGTVIICASATAGPTISCQGFMTVDNAGAAIQGGMVNTGLTTTGQKSINTQTGGALGVSVQFSVANAGNIFTMSSLLVEEVR